MYVIYRYHFIWNIFFPVYLCLFDATVISTGFIPDSLRSVSSANCDFDKYLLLLRHVNLYNEGKKLIFSECKCMYNKLIFLSLWPRSSTTKQLELRSMLTIGVLGCLNQPTIKLTVWCQISRIIIEVKCKDVLVWRTCQK